MLVWRKTRPVSSRGVHLNHHQLVRRKIRPEDIDNLPGSVLPATEAGKYLFWRDQLRLQLGLGGHSALGNFANRLRLECDRMSRREIHGVRQAVKNILPLPD